MMLLVAFLVLSDTAPASIEGYWINPSRSVIVEIAPCGEQLCGTVTWASDKAKADAAKGGTRDLVGARLMSGFIEKKTGWWDGRLFIADLNRTCRADITEMGEDRLKVRGCAIGKTLCKSQEWTRARASAP